MSYDLSDFTESIRVAGVERDAISRVALAFGEQGDLAEWHGGFVCEMKDGSWTFIFGWCDTTGWGCQDDAFVYRYSEHPTDYQLDQAWRAEMDGDEIPRVEADIDPADLNRFVRGELNRWGEPVATDR